MKRFLPSMFICLSVAAVVAIPALADPGHDHDHATTAPTTQSLGTLTIDGFEMEVIQDGQVVAGKEATFEIKIKGDKEPRAVRVWIGIESARGSRKGKAHKHDDKMEVHADVPDPMPEGSKLWIEVEQEDKKTARSIAFK